MDGQAERPFNDVFENFLDAAREYADHPETPEKAVRHVTHTLRCAAELPHLFDPYSTPDEGDWIPEELAV